MEPFDLVYAAPPTFSNSKATAKDFDVQRDHVALIRAARGVLAPGGVIVFSTHRRRFRLEEQALGGLRVEDITRSTIPFDFERRRPHRCWRITRTEQP